MYKDGKPDVPIPEDPWQYPSGNMGYYGQQGKILVDSSCGQMARYAARFVGWYTQGGFTDECGQRHHSGLFYKWRYLSVLNEDEHMMSDER